VLTKRGYRTNFPLRSKFAAERGVKGYGRDQKEASSKNEHRIPSTGNGVCFAIRWMAALLFCTRFNRPRGPEYCCDREVDSIRE